MLATYLYLNDYHIPSLKQTGKKPYTLEVFIPLPYCSTLRLWLQVSSAHATELSQMRTWVPCTCICANIKRAWIYKKYVIFCKVTWAMVQTLATLNFVLHKVYKIATTLTCCWRIQTQVFLSTSFCLFTTKLSIFHCPSFPLYNIQLVFSWQHLWWSQRFLLVCNSPITRSG